MTRHATMSIVLLLSAAMPAAAQAPCAALAAQYDQTLKELELASARGLDASVSARIADRSALLDLMIEKGCPMPERFLSIGYGAAAGQCVISDNHAEMQKQLDAVNRELRALGVSPSAASDPGSKKVPPVAQACDQATWTYKLP